MIYDVCTHNHTDIYNRYIHIHVHAYGHTHSAENVEIIDALRMPNSKSIPDTVKCQTFKANSFMEKQKSTVPIAVTCS